MLQCQVLRCQRRATHNFVIEDDAWGMAETMICDVHKVALDGGVAYTYNNTENVIYFGQDLESADDL
jgi:hypothetical protein